MGGGVMFTRVFAFGEAGNAEVVVVADVVGASNADLESPISKRKGGPSR